MRATSRAAAAGLSRAMWSPTASRSRSAGTAQRSLMTKGAYRANLASEDLLPEDLLPEDLLPEDLLPEDLVFENLALTRTTSSAAAKSPRSAAAMPASILPSCHAFS